MKLALIPQPQQIHFGGGFLEIPSKGVIGITDHSLYSVAQKLKSIFKAWSVNISADYLQDTISIGLGKNLKPGGYRLVIEREKIMLEGFSPAAIFHGVQTLFQIIGQSPSGKLPLIKIDDWPDIPERGVYYDITRGRVPKLERLKQLADTLAQYKINQLQLYIEHVFAFRGHPDIGKDASPLTAEDILELDAYCRERYIELVPSLASFGHLATVLKHPQYHRLAEDWGKGKYVTPDADKQLYLKEWIKEQKITGFTLSPANPDVYEFLESLFAEFLPLFSSGRFNVCCDETVDLGYGQSYKLCQKIGRGQLYLRHLLKLNDICQKYGKKIMFWGDIIRHYPELIFKIPKDITVLDWNYDSNHNFEKVSDFQKAGLSFYACPGVCSFGLFPFLPRARANISGFATATFKYGGRGLLNTDWGNNFMEYSWPGFLFGAEQGWNTKADRESFTNRFSRLFLKSADPSLGQAIDKLGKISDKNVSSNYSSIWQSLYFASPGKPVFPSEGGVNAKLGRDTLQELEQIRTVFRKHMSRGDEDPLQVLPYWIFAIDTICHAARKLTVYGYGGKVTAAAQTGLRREFASLRTQFKKLWMERSRPSEINIVLDGYRRASRAAISFERTKAITDFVSKIMISRSLPGAGNLQSLDYPGNKKLLGFAVREFPGTFCDLHNDLFASGKQDQVVFLCCYLQAVEPMELSACIGYDGPLKVWIDGDMKFHDPNGTNPATVDKASVSFKVNPGKHEILIALSSNNGKAWGLFLRFLRRDVSLRQIEQGPSNYSMPKVGCARN